MRILPIIAMALLLSGWVAALSAVRVPGQAWQSILPGAYSDVRDLGMALSHHFYPCRSSLVFDTLLLPLDAATDL